MLSGKIDDVEFHLAEDESGVAPDPEIAFLPAFVALEVAYRRAGLSMQTTYDRELKDAISSRLPLWEIGELLAWVLHADSFQGTIRDALTELYPEIWGIVGQLAYSRGLRSHFSLDASWVVVNEAADLVESTSVVLKNKR